MEQVATDIGMELVFSEKGVPRGRGKVERFFRSVDQLFLQDMPGYAPKGYGEVEATLTLSAFEQHFRTWLLEDYHHRVHSETACQPKERWEMGGFVPRMPTSMEQLDLLLLTVAKMRRVQQDGVHFQSHRYMGINLAAFVKEEVLIRYDPADLGEVHVFYQDRFLCRAICAELSDRKVSLKEIEKAISERRKQVRAGLSTRAALVDRYMEMHQTPPPAPKTVVAEPVAVGARPRLKRYINE